MRKKSQVALEFLMTYGWAILIVMVALGSLAYFGVLNPSRVLPERCIFGNGLTCQDSLLTSDAANISLLNGMGQSIYGVAVEPDGFIGECEPNTTAIDMGPDTTLQVNCTISSPSLTTGQKGKVKFKVTFQKVSGGFNQVSLGEVYSTVQ
jgi:hypothetical protein